MFAGIVIGLIIGILAEFLMPDINPMGFIMSIALGMLGGLFALYFGVEMQIYQLNHPIAWIWSAIGAMIPITAYQITRRKRGY